MYEVQQGTTRYKVQGNEVASMFWLNGHPTACSPVLPWVSSTFYITLLNDINSVDCSLEEKRAKYILDIIPTILRDIFTGEKHFLAERTPHCVINKFANLTNLTECP